jgi:HEAT repeat protein
VGSSLRQLWHDVKSLITLSPRSKRTWEILSVGGPEAVPVLLELLRDDDDYVRFWAAQSVRLLTMRKEPAVREEVGPQVQEVVSCLIEALHDNQDGVRMTAAGILRNIGTEAKEAVPALIETLHDQSAAVRSKAAEALKRIDPEAAARAR